MDFVRQFDPRNLLTVFARIDAETKAKGPLPSPDNKIIIALVLSAFCLLLVFYAKYSSFFYSMLAMISEFLHDDRRAIFKELRSHTFSNLYGHAWWGFIHLLGFLLIPMACIKWIFKEKVADHGWQVGDIREHLRWYIFLASPIVCFAAIVSFRQDFSTHYPFYDLAYRSWADLILWEAIYIIQFISLEFFFRGFMLNSTKHAFGSNAILVMCLPYLMIHFQKPWLEATGAIFFGLFLGTLAMCSRSIWGGVGVHVTIALAMDLFALLQTRGLPSQLWPN